MFFRLLPLYLVFVLPLNAAAHINGHSHLPDVSEKSAHGETQAPESHPQKTLESITAGQQVLRQEIRLLHREIAVLRAEQARPGLTEVLGGIGYIIGFFGLYAWFRARRKPA